MAWAEYPERRILRRRDLLKASGAAAVALALAACGGSSTSSTSAATAGVSATTAPKPAATTEPSSTTAAASVTTGSASATTGGAGATTAFNPPADLVDKAKKEGKVQLYTSLDTQIVDAIIKAFKDKYGIDVQYYRAGSAGVTQKVLAEADAGKVQADIVDASDVAAFLAMKQRGLLKPYDSPATKTVAANLRDPDNTWVADRLTQGVIQYNTKVITGGDVPKHWKDLTDPKYSGKLIFFSASTGDGAPRLYTLAKTFGYDLLKGFAANKPLRVDTPQLVTQTLENGERSVGFLQNDNIAWRSKQDKKPTDYFFPDEGVPTELGAVGLMKDAAHPNAATLFYEWWMGNEGQKILVDGGKYSSRSDLAPPTGSPPLSDLKLLVHDYADYQAHRADILGQMTTIFGGEWGV